VLQSPQSGNWGVFLEASFEILDDDDPLRTVKEDIHMSCECLFTPEELTRLRKVKERKRWLPADRRHGYRPIFSPSLEKKWKKLFYQTLREEFEEILGREEIPHE
jgi:hypothetical protein